MLHLQPNFDCRWDLLPFSSCHPSTPVFIINFIGDQGRIDRTKKTTTTNEGAQTFLWLSFRDEMKWWLSHLCCRVETVYGVYICPKGNLHYIWPYPKSNTIQRWEKVFVCLAKQEPGRARQKFLATTYNNIQSWAKKWSIGCVNSRPAARGTQERGIHVT